MNNKIQTSYDDLVEKGIYYAKKFELNSALNNFLKAVDLEKSRPEAYINLSNIYILSKNYKRAFKILQNYGFKYEISILDHLWKLSINYNLEKNLFNYLFKLEKLDNSKYQNRYFLFFLIGKLYIRYSNLSKAIDYFKKSINLNTKNIHSYINMLDCLERLNKIKDLKKYLDLCEENLNTNDPKVIFFQSLYLNRIKEFKKSEEMIINYKLEKKLVNENYYYPRILNLKSKNNEKLENYSNSFEFIEKRNNFLSSLKENKRIKRENYSQLVQKYKSVYTSKNLYLALEQSDKLKNDNINLAFLVGFPRSGTTLLDTILRTSSETIVLEEKPFLPNLWNKYFDNKNRNLNSISNITSEEIIDLRKYYFNQINLSEQNKNKLIIDKIPLTLAELAFVKIIFPESKIILALRHPCDVVLSCFFTSFKMNEAMINFLDWEDTINFYNNVFELFEFYEQQLQLNYIKIKYENVINDFTKEVSKLFNFLNLKYKKNIENFHKVAQNRKSISTPSYTQVIDPLYSNSIGRWKKYKKHINLESQLKKWIIKFNY